MTKYTYNEAYKIAEDQYHQHDYQASGAWSVTREVAKDVCESLNVDFDEAVDNQREHEDEQINELVNDEIARVRSTLSVMRDDLSESWWDELREALFEKHGEDAYATEGYSVHFWDHVKNNASKEK